VVIFGGGKLYLANKENKYYSKFGLKLLKRKRRSKDRN
jgi:hypothetical protein